MFENKNSLLKKRNGRGSNALTPDKRFICDLCGKGYCSYPSLYTHQRNKHGRQRKGVQYGRPRKGPEQNEEDKHLNLQFKYQNDLYIALRSFGQNKNGTSLVYALEIQTENDDPWIADRYYGTKFGFQNIRNAILKYNLKPPSILELILTNRLDCNDELKEILDNVPRVTDPASANDEVLSGFLGGVLAWISEKLTPSFWNELTLFFELLMTAVDTFHKLASMNDDNIYDSMNVVRRAYVPEVDPDFKVLFTKKSSRVEINRKNADEIIFHLKRLATVYNFMT